VAAQPGIERIRLFKRTGHIRYTTDNTEAGSIVDVEKEACLTCHQDNQKPINGQGCRARTRIFYSGKNRILGLITPVYNENTCTGASCHASVTEEPILGVLDVHLSLKEIDDTLIEQNRDFLLITYVLMLGLATICGVFVWQFVHKPVKSLITGTTQLSKGNLGHRIPIQSHTEMGCLAESFNQMASELELAQQQLTDWNHSLEKRVEEKTLILKQAQTKLIQNEKMASLGTLSAAVAHEINNPLSGVLTYTRLLRKLLDTVPSSPERLPDIHKYLEVIASEVSRCGKIVSNLLDFSRQSNIRIASANLNQVLDRALFLIGHKLKLQNIQLQQDLLPDLPQITCDADQIQQALLALLLNAIEAMPDGGSLKVTTRKTDVEVQIFITDTGLGMSPSQIAHIFEPFYTTKSALNGVGLGLAIVYGIIHRHKGHIDVQSKEGSGTTFEISLPIATQITEYDTSQFEGAVL
jgi:two-component system NtrC family sensor kinase